MTENGPILDTDLHAYVDGELDARTLAEVEKHLAEHPDDAAKVHAYRLQKLHLHELYDDGLDAPLPAGVEAALKSGRLAARWPQWRRVAAAAMIFVFGGAAGWGGFAYLGGGSGSGEPETTYVRRALDAHVVYAHDTMRPVETGFGQESEMVGWLSDRVGYRLRRPDLQGAGFRLIGGRLVNDRGMPAALFMYEDDRRRRVTLYVCSQPETGKTAFRFIAEHGMVAFYWTDGPLAYALTGEMPRGEVLKLAQMVYADIEGESH